MREFRFIRKGSQPLIWKIFQEDEKYTTIHGIQDGAMQTFSDIPGPKGKENTKAYVNAVDNAKFCLEREIRKKTERGYIEYVNGQPVTEQVSFIDFNKPLPKNFASYKPQTSIEPKSLQKLDKEGKVSFSRKYDGQCHFAVHHPWGWEIYTRRIDLASERFPNHITALERSDLESGTILVGEMVCQRPDNTDDFKAISRICRSDPEEARKLISDKECPEPTFFIFDILFKDGKDLSDLSYNERKLLWKDKFINQLIEPVETFSVTCNNWQALAKENNWEGFVGVDGTFVPGKKFYSYDGTPPRPKGHFKLKVTYETDVIIFASAPGSGKRLGKVGAVYTKQIHPETGKFVFTGKCGSGFSDESLEEIEKELTQHNIPMLEKEKDAEKLSLEETPGVVAMVEFGNRIAKSQKLRFPVFIRTRDDKLPKECIIENLADEEDEEC